MRAKINKIKNLNFWTVAKWMSIGLIVFYIGWAFVVKAADDFLGTHVSFQVNVSYSSDGLLKPVVAENK